MPDKEEPTKKDEGALKPNEETLHTTDPQEHMEGPISSLVQKTSEGFKKEESVEGDDEEESKK